MHPRPKERKRPILNVLTNNGNSATGSNTAVVGTGTGTGRPTPIKDAVQQGGTQLRNAADDLRGGLRDAADSVKKALGGDDNDTDNGDASGSGEAPNRCGAAPVRLALRAVERAHGSTRLVTSSSSRTTSVHLTMTGQRRRCRTPDIYPLFVRRQVKSPRFRGCSLGTGVMRDSVESRCGSTAVTQRVRLPRRGRKLIPIKNRLRRKFKGCG